MCFLLVFAPAGRAAGRPDMADRQMEGDMLLAMEGAGFADKAARPMLPVQAASVLPSRFARGPHVQSPKKLAKW